MYGTFLAKDQLMSAQPVRLDAVSNLCDARYAPQLSNSEILNLIAEFGSPLLTIDLTQIREQLSVLRGALPDVDLHYALKPLSHAAVVACLHEQAMGFDLASIGEMDLVLAQGVSASRCIYTHPIKRVADIDRVLGCGISTFVVDNYEEIYKLAAYGARTRSYLRLAFRNPRAVADLSRKFGCEADSALDLLARAQELGVQICGLAFGAGSQVLDPSIYVHAIDVCARLMRDAVAAGLPPLELLDIGGGFPVAYCADAPICIESYYKPIREALSRLPAHVNVIAEPGRFIAAPAGTSIARVVGKAKRGGRWWYYLDEGIYGAYSGRIFDHAKYPIRTLSSSAERLASVLAGPTCDSFDVIDDDILLPRLEVGDVVVGSMMGAYTWATATSFNSLEKARPIVLDCPGGGPRRPLGT
jgi:ornithine decarboxylase